MSKEYSAEIANATTQFLTEDDWHYRFDKEKGTTNQDIKTKYELFDGCYGIVTERCRAGAYLLLDDGEEAFAYRFGNLFPGTKVLCTVLREAKEAKKMLVSIDAVLEYAGFAA